MTFRILTVCTGNICRSPVAELILANSLADLDVQVSSRGTGALVGHGVPEQAQKIASLHGIDATHHLAQQINEASLKEADLVLAMARDHRRLTVEITPASMRRSFTLRELARIADAVQPDLKAVIANANVSTADEGMRVAIAHATIMRGTVPPPDSPDDLDVVDPYRRSDETYARSFAELKPAAETVARYLAAAAAASVID